MLAQNSPLPEKSPTRIHLEEQPGTQRAVLHYRTVGSSTLGPLLEIELETGRKHQIRAQLLSIGAPVLGDHRYGSKKTYRDNAIALHAGSLTFPHPIGGVPVTYTATPPWD